MRRILLTCALCLLAVALHAQQGSKTPPPPAPPPDDHSGTYAFLQEGEFVQVTVEDAGKVTGFVSRYGDLDSDRGFAFLDQFFKTGQLDGNKLTFTTETVHGEWFDFKGTIERGEGKNPGDEAYYVLKGTLIEYITDVNKKTTSKTREVVFKEFPQDLSPPPSKRD